MQLWTSELVNSLEILRKKEFSTTLLFYIFKYQKIELKPQQRLMYAMVEPQLALYNSYTQSMKLSSSMKIHNIWIFNIIFSLNEKKHNICRWSRGYCDWSSSLEGGDLLPTQSKSSSRSLQWHLWRTEVNVSEISHWIGKR